MINWDNLGNKKKNVVIILIFILVLLIVTYGVIIYNKILKNSFANQIIEISDKNEETVFSVERIYLCSSANAVYDSEEQDSKDLDIYQYTDIAIYLNNYQDEYGTTTTNTIKELYIDNIELTVSDNEGNQSLQYINSLEIGNKEIIPDFVSTDRIDFNIVYTNDENDATDYDEPTFYTDCSNPITLRYVNNIGAGYSLKEDSSSSFDGSILEDANISIDEISCKVKFKINIVNNDGEYFSCWLNFSLPLDDIYNGTTIKTASLSGYKYNFYNHVL